jgi:hypothetical protein
MPYKQLRTLTINDKILDRFEAFNRRTAARGGRFKAAPRKFKRGGSECGSF